MSFTSKGNPLESLTHGQPSASRKCLNLPHEFWLSSIKGKNVKNLSFCDRLRLCRNSNLALVTDV